MRHLPLVLLPVPLAAQTYFPPPDTAGGWRTLTAAPQIRKTTGIDLARLDAAFNYAQRTSAHGGLLVARHGYLVYEKYFGQGHREAHPDMASIGKAYASIACGIVINEKKSEIPEGLDQKVFTAQYLPEALPLNPRKADIRLGHLLSMSSGMHGDGNNPGFVRGVPGKLEPMAPITDPLDIDGNALRVPMWTTLGEGYSYSSSSTHIASMVLRRLAGMELQQYLDLKLAKPMGWGAWGYALHRPQGSLPHTPGGGSIAVRATDALRFAYLLLHQGRWAGQQLVPADYVALCARPSKYNAHSPFGLMFESNAGGHVPGAPRDAYFKSGAGGSAIYVVPSLDLVIYKMAGSTPMFDPALTRIPNTHTVDHSRDAWKPVPHTQFDDGPIGGDDGVRRLLEMVVAAVIN
jgi:CubicO group peptidase (beta-lactamase class C family)